MIKYYADCDAVLRKHLDYQDKIDSSPVEPRSQPKFIAVCEDVLGRYDIDYFRAIHHELKQKGLIQINVNLSNLDEPFWRNVLTQKGFHFCQTTSFVKEYQVKRRTELQNQLFIVLGVVAAIVSAIYSGLTYYKPDSSEKANVRSSSEESRKSRQLPKFQSRSQLKDTLIRPTLPHK